MTLNIDGLISNLKIIYTPGTNAQFDEPRSILCLVSMRIRVSFICSFIFILSSANSLELSKILPYG